MEPMENTRVLRSGSVRSSVARESVPRTPRATPVRHSRPPTSASSSASSSNRNQIMGPPQPASAARIVDPGSIASSSTANSSTPRKRGRPRNSETPVRNNSPRQNGAVMGPPLPPIPGDLPPRRHGSRNTCEQRQMSARRMKEEEPDAPEENGNDVPPPARNGAQIVDPGPIASSSTANSSSPRKRGRPRNSETPVRNNSPRQNGAVMGPPLPPIPGDLPPRRHGSLNTCEQRQQIQDQIRMKKEEPDAHEENGNDTRRFTMLTETQLRDIDEIVTRKVNEFAAAGKFRHITGTSSSTTTRRFTMLTETQLRQIDEIVTRTVNELTAAGKFRHITGTSSSTAIPGSRPVSAAGSSGPTLRKRGRPRNETPTPVRNVPSRQNEAVMGPPCAPVPEARQSRRQAQKNTIKEEEPDAPEENEDDLPPPARNEAQGPRNQSTNDRRYMTLTESELRHIAGSSSTAATNQQAHRTSRRNGMNDRPTSSSTSTHTTGHREIKTEPMETVVANEGRVCSPTTVKNRSREKVVPQPEEPLPHQVRNQNPVNNAASTSAAPRSNGSLPPRDFVPPASFSRQSSVQPHVPIGNGNMMPAPPILAPPGLIPPTHQHQYYGPVPNQPMAYQHNVPWRPDSQYQVQFPTGPMPHPQYAPPIPWEQLYPPYPAPSFENHPVQLPPGGFVMNGVQSARNSVQPAPLPLFRESEQPGPSSSANGSVGPRPPPIQYEPSGRLQQLLTSPATVPTSGEPRNNIHRQDHNDHQVLNADDDVPVYADLTNMRTMPSASDGVSRDLLNDAGSLRGFYDDRVINNAVRSLVPLTSNVPPVQQQQGQSPSGGIVMNGTPNLGSSARNSMQYEPPVFRQSEQPVSSSYSNGAMQPEASSVPVVQHLPSNQPARMLTPLFEPRPRQHSSSSSEEISVIDPPHQAPSARSSVQPGPPTMYRGSVQPPSSSLSNGPSSLSSSNEPSTKSTGSSIDTIIDYVASWGRTRGPLSLPPVDPITTKHQCQDDLRQERVSEVQDAQNHQVTNVGDVSNEGLSSDGSNEDQGAQSTKTAEPTAKKKQNYSNAHRHAQSLFEMDDGRNCDGSEPSSSTNSSSSGIDSMHVRPQYRRNRIVNDNNSTRTDDGANRSEAVDNDSAVGNAGPVDNDGDLEIVGANQTQAVRTILTPVRNVPSRQNETLMRSPCPPVPDVPKSTVMNFNLHVAWRKRNAMNKQFAIRFMQVCLDHYAEKQNGRWKTQYPFEHKLQSDEKFRLRRLLREEICPNLTMLHRFRKRNNLGSEFLSMFNKEREIQKQFENDIYERGLRTMTAEEEKIVERELDIGVWEDFHIRTMNVKVVSQALKYRFNAHYLSARERRSYATERARLRNTAKALLTSGHHNFAPASPQQQRSMPTRSRQPSTSNNAILRSRVRTPSSHGNQIIAPASSRRQPPTQSRQPSTTNDVDPITTKRQCQDDLRQERISEVQDANVGDVRNEGQNSNGSNENQGAQSTKTAHNSVLNDSDNAPDFEPILENDAAPEPVESIPRPVGPVPGPVEQVSRPVDPVSRPVDYDPLGYEPAYYDEDDRKYEPALEDYDVYGEYENSPEDPFDRAQYYLPNEDMIVKDEGEFIEEYDALFLRPAERRSAIDPNIDWEKYSQKFEYRTMKSNERETIGEWLDGFWFVRLDQKFASYETVFNKRQFSNLCLPKNRSTNWKEWTKKQVAEWSQQLIAPELVKVLQKEQIAGRDLHIFLHDRFKMSDVLAERYPNFEKKEFIKLAFGLKKLVNQLAKSQRLEAIGIREPVTTEDDEKIDNDFYLEFPDKENEVGEPAPQYPGPEQFARPAHDDGEDEVLPPPEILLERMDSTDDRSIARFIDNQVQRRPETQFPSYNKKINSEHILLPKNRSTDWRRWTRTQVREWLGQFAPPFFVWQVQEEEIEGRHLHHVFLYAFGTDVMEDRWNLVCQRMFPTTAMLEAQLQFKALIDVLKGKDMAKIEEELIDFNSFK